MEVVWIFGGCALGIMLAVLLASLGVVQVQVWRTERQVYAPLPELSPAQVRWGNEKRRSEDPEATLIIASDDPDYIRPVDWQALQARGKPWPFRTGARPGTSPRHDYIGHADC